MSSPSKKRLIVSYALLVGIPLLGIVGVLGAGRRLTPPISVAGSWDFQIDPSATQAKPCFAGLGFTRSIVLSISQSGRYLTLKINSQHWASLTGTLQGKEVAANLSLPSTATCNGALGVLLSAEIQPQTVPRVMAGTLKFDGCPSCGSAHFQAVRQELDTKKLSE